MANRCLQLVAWLVALPLATWPAATEAQVTGGVAGRVTDSTSGRPISDARLEIPGAAVTARTAQDGAFLIRNLAPGTYKIGIRAAGFTPSATEVAVRNGRMSEVSVRLVPIVARLDEFRVLAVADTSAPNAVVFSRDDIERAGARDLADLIQTAPGVTVTRAGGPGQPARVSIRGSASSQVLIVLDGVPINNAISGGADLSRIDLERVERVTLLTGAQSARYGAGALAGVIEITSRRSTRELTAATNLGATGEAGISATVGTAHSAHDATITASVNGVLQQNRGDFRYRIPEVRGGGSARRLNADVTNRNFVATSAVENGDYRVDLRGSMSLTTRGMAGSVVQPSLTGRENSRRLGGSITAQWAPGNWILSMTEDIANERGHYADPSPPFGRVYDDTTSATGFTTSARITRRFSSATVSGGVDLRHLSLRSNRLSASAPKSQQISGIWVTAQAGRNIGRKFAGSPVRLSADLALRTDRESISRELTFSPRLMLRAESGPLALSASTGSAYSPPSISDQFFHEGVQVRANPNLKPERVNGDLELRLSMREQPLGPLMISADAAAFRSDITGMILWFPNFQFVWSPNNYDVRRRGWEARTTISAPDAHLSIDASISTASVIYTGSVLSGQVAYRPRLTATVQSSLIFSKVRADFTTRHTGLRRTVPGSTLNALAPFSMTDLRISGTLVRGSWITSPVFSIENLFNRNAAMLVDYPFPTRLWRMSVRISRSTSPA